MPFFLKTYPQCIVQSPKQQYDIANANFKEPVAREKKYKINQLRCKFNALQFPAFIKFY